ncbi:MAG TPA: hypothetical protein VM695_16110 [Phycisphaerae bacterium]|nr:hypothetical protein [Phycisphaerae bacterium]
MITSDRDQFNAKRQLWVQCLDGDDRHSVTRQITRMTWNAAAFRVINEARRIAPPAKEGGLQLNGLMHSLIDDCFFESQMLAIRRLTDSYPITGDRRGRDVFSLTSLLRHMEKNAKLMTRSNLLAAEGLEYDYEAVREKEREYHRERMLAGERAYFVPRSLDSHGLQTRQEQIDFLAGVVGTQRSPDDSVRPEILSHLRRKVLGACEEIRVRVDKFVAHAASPDSRQAEDADAMRVDLNHIWEAHKAICEVANFVDMYLLTGTSHGFLAVPQYDQFAYIDRPLVASGCVADLRAMWDAYEKETGEWGLWGIDELRTEMG